MSGTVAEVAGRRVCLYVSFVDLVDGRWRIDMLMAEHPSRFDAYKRQEVFTAGSVVGTLGVERVKDPAVLRAGSEYCMLISFAAGAA